MKVPEAILVLAVVLGSQALVIREAPVSGIQLRDIVDGIFGVTIETYMVIAEKLSVIRNTKFGEILIQEYGQADKPLDGLDRELSPEVREAMDIIQNVPTDVIDRIYRTLQEIDRRATPGFNEVMEALAAYVDPTLEKATSFVVPVLEPIVVKAKEINQQVNEKLQEALQSLDGQLSLYAQDLQDARVALQPLVDDAVKQVRQGLGSLSKNLTPYVKPFLKETEKYKKEFEEWKQSPVLPPKEEA